MGGILEYFGNTLTSQLQAGSVISILFAFLFGVFVGLTPCVYPILPVTISFIGSVSRGSKLRGFLYSLVYAMGMALVYGTVGVIFSATGKQLGSLWNNGWLLLILANFFIVLSLWQLRAINIPLPQFIRGGSRRSGILGALGVGAASGLVVGPCTLPGLAAVATLIAWAARGGHHGSLLFGAVVMFAYSVGLGSLVILCGTFSGLLANLPKSGRWLAVIEKSFAIIMLLTAEFFLVLLGQNAKFPSLTSALLANPVTETQSQEETASVLPPETTENAWEWELKDLDGRLVRSADFLGKKGVLLVFFATWCPYCMEEVPKIKNFTETYSEMSIKVIGVAVDQTSGIIRKFAEENEIPYLLLLDEGGNIANRFSIPGIPMIVGIDASGILKYAEHRLPQNTAALARSLEAGITSTPAEPPDLEGGNHGANPGN